MTLTVGEYNPSWRNGVIFPSYVPRIDDKNGWYEKFEIQKKYYCGLICRFCGKVLRVEKRRVPFLYSSADEESNE